MLQLKQSNSLRCQNTIRPSGRQGLPGARGLSMCGVFARDSAIFAVFFAKTYSERPTRCASPAVTVPPLLKTCSVGVARYSGRPSYSAHRSATRPRCLSW
jgi:hypothetical protein